MTERFYHGDSFLRTFSTRVADIREASRSEGVSISQIALDRSAFYPTLTGCCLKVIVHLNAML